MSRIAGYVVATALLGGAVAARADGIDLSVGAIEVTQVIPSSEAPLVAGRPILVRASIAVGPQAAGPVPGVDALLRIYVDGVETAESPVLSENGPITAPLTVDLDSEQQTVNFPWVPTATDNVVLEVEVNPAGPAQRNEPDFENNLLSVGPLSFECRRVPEIVYVPIDHRPGGGSLANEPVLELLAPGIGDNFVRAIYPTPDWNYHRTSFPRYLWTGPQDATLLDELETLRVTTVPTPDFIYGWFRGSVEANGLAELSGRAAFGNTELERFQRTFAHELGHNFGLLHNLMPSGVRGIDVERHLHITEDLPRIKPATLADVMFPGLTSAEAWISTENYTLLFDHPVLTCAQPTPVADKVLWVTGVIDRQKNGLSLGPAVELPAMPVSAAAPAATADVILKTYTGGALVDQIAVLARTSGSDCAFCRVGGDSMHEPIGAPLHVAVHARGPDGSPVDRIVVIDPRSGQVMAERARSAGVPQIEIEAPASGAVVTGRLLARWHGADPDGDPLTYYVQYSPNGGATLTPLLVNSRQQQLSVDAADLPASNAGQGLLRLTATDGMNTSVVEVTGVTIGTEHAPWVDLITPDQSTSHRLGATIALRATAWDLEDGMLEGGSLVWDSSRIGNLGVGRILSTAQLPTGANVITVTATDVDGMTASDSVTIIITDRVLPDTDADCNSNASPDHLDIAAGTSIDCNSNNFPDECERDCNGDGVLDACDVAAGTSSDANGNNVPDECEPDCNSNGIIDTVETNLGTSADCNFNGMPDECELSAGVSEDCNANGVLDICETDCNGNGALDACDVAEASSADCNSNGVPDECESDCDANGVPDDCDLANCAGDPGCGDCNGNGLPDRCDPDCNQDGVPDFCEIAECAGDPQCSDCNGNGLPDACDIVGGTVTAHDCCEAHEQAGCNDQSIMFCVCAVDVFCCTEAWDELCTAAVVERGCDTCAGGASLDCNGDWVPDECQLSALITQQPGNTAACTGGAVELSVVSGHPNAVYRWFKDGGPLANGGNISGANAATLTITNVSTADPGSYACRVSDGCLSLISDEAQVLLSSPIQIQQQPAESLSRCAGQDASFVVSVLGSSPRTFDWRRNGVSIGASNSPALILHNVVPADAGSYTCLVSNPCSAVLSSPGALTVHGVGFVLHPESRCADAGSTVVFTSAVTDSQEALFSWRRNGAALMDDPPHLTGAFTDTLTITGVDEADEAEYTLAAAVLEPEFCVNESEPALLTVDDCPACPAPGDFDGDGDVDLRDMQQFAGCFGAGGALAPQCACANIDDGDEEVDLADWEALRQIVTGPLP